jgi:hypothetical protein
MRGEREMKGKREARRKGVAVESMRGKVAKGDTRDANFCERTGDANDEKSPVRVGGRAGGLRKEGRRVG